MQLNSDARCYITAHVSACCCILMVAWATWCPSYSQAITIRGASWRFRSLGSIETLASAISMAVYMNAVMLSQGFVRHATGGQNYNHKFRKMLLQATRSGLCHGSSDCLCHPDRMDVQCALI
jgi:hypothetical protein